MSREPWLVVILGPTASGKSALGVRLARQFDGEVVICDSAQVYRQFRIGTGKVLPAERGDIPHHLMDLVEPEENFTAGEYRRRALCVLKGLRQRNKLPILTAGTGLYLRALLEGLSDAPQRSDALRERLRRRAETLGPEYLHRLLKRLDPEAARRVAARDRQKLVRAIEINLLAGQRVSEVYRSGRKGLEGFSILKLGLAPLRRELYARIHTRVAAMLQQGWLEEVGQFLVQGVPPTARPFQFIGYKQLVAHLGGRYTLEETTQLIQQETRRYAKRQITWFRRELGVKWFSGFGDDQAIAAEASEYVRSALLRSDAFA